MPPLLSLLLSFMVGVGSAQDDPVSVDELLENVAAEHVESPAADELRAAAVEGILLWLERHEGSEHLQILTYEQHEQRLAHARGERFGVGIGVLLVPGYGVRILEVFEGTPAAEAGLVGGDVVVAVNGVAVENRPVAEVAHLLAARDREQLVLELVGRDGHPRSVSLAPEAYRAPPLSVSDGDGYRMIRLHHFGRGAADQLWRALEEVAPDAQLMVDLRDVRDGLLDEVVRSAAPFLGDEELACYRAQGKEPAEPVAVPDSPRWDRPFAVLVNGGTQGLAELFAAMIQRVNPAMSLVGTPTAGIDALPTWVEIGPDRLLQLAGTRLSLADGTTWARVGVVPDVVVQAVNGPQFIPPPAPPADLQIDAALRMVSTPGTSPPSE
jgi:carboxyl-terminal processing protease